jgi:hypothetical protein
MLKDSLKKISVVFNKMIEDGIIETYAIGGGVSAVLYTEPHYTKDLDIFVFPDFTPSGLVDPTKVLRYLTGLGFKMDEQFVMMYGEKVDVVPAYKPLVVEAIEKSVLFDIEGIPFGVFEPEYIVAIALDTGRNKDYARIDTFLEFDILNKEKLKDILKRFNLLSEWNLKYG